MPSRPTKTPTSSTAQRQGRRCEHQRFVGCAGGALEGHHHVRNEKSIRKPRTRFLRDRRRADVHQSLWRAARKFSSQGTTDPIADINPEDIVSRFRIDGRCSSRTVRFGRSQRRHCRDDQKGTGGTASSPKSQNRYGTGNLPRTDGAEHLSWGQSAQQRAKQNGLRSSPRLLPHQHVQQRERFPRVRTQSDLFQLRQSTPAASSWPNNSYDRYNFTTFRNTTLS